MVLNFYQLCLHSSKTIIKRGLMEYADEKLETQDIALNSLIQSGTNKLERLEGLQVMN